MHSPTLSLYAAWVHKLRLVITLEVFFSFSHIVFVSERATFGFLPTYPALPEIETFSEDARAGDEARLPTPLQRSTTRGLQLSMAHVLLPCDLPSWPDVQKLLQRVRSCKGSDNVIKIMLQVHEASSVSLDPEDSAPIRGHPGFECLGKFLGEENLPGRILADIADWAAKLPKLKPGYGLHYSLRTEESTLCLERPFVVSLMANAFFSMFPRRKVKTHPTLLDFNMAEFFTHLEEENHQKKLRAFFRYFEGLEPEPDGIIQFSRKVFRGPSLPGWLCSERPLVPLVIRPQGTIDEAEPWVFRGCSCSSSVGGDVLCESTSKESVLFFEFPELIASLCFLESLVDDEALIVEGIRAPNTQDVNFCFMDVPYIEQFDDCNLLKSLNKAVAAFQHEPRFVDRRRTPDGGESSERSCESREGRISTAAERLRRIDCPKTLSAKYKKSLSQASSKFSMRTASESSVKLDDEYYTADEESEPESTATRPDRPPSSMHSFGFVLAHSEGEDDDLSSRHERLEDFRRRIRKRTRRRRMSRRSSSYSSGGSSSDMEDISEDPEENVKPILTVRPACSEPSLVNLADTETEYPPWLSPDALLSPSGHKQLAATCSGGHLKSYSHDGVRPNLPVPFRARFRIKKRTSDDWDRSRSTDDKGCLPSRCPVAVAAGGMNEDPQLRALVLWLAASMAQLPALILYTMSDPSLKEVIQIYNQVLNRQWKVGDLACEVLRFCRNRMAPGHRTGKHSHLFGQLLADKNVEERPMPVATRKIFTDESLD